MSGPGIRLTVIIPMYNAAATVGRTLASLRHIPDPERPRTQVVVINDGSTDGSLGIVGEYRGRDGAGFRWEVIDRPNGGVSSARNAGLAVAAGEWLFLLDADDELAFNPFAVLDSARDLTCLAFSVAYCRHGRPWRRLKPARLGPRNWADVLTAGCPYPTSSLLVRRDCITQPFDEGIRHTEDWLFWMRNPRVFDRMETFPERVAAVIHVHDRNATLDDERWGLDRARVARQVADAYAGRLTRKQRNNLSIQEQIGALQQRKRVPPATFLRFPCDPLLYGKLWVYALAAAVNRRANLYQGGDGRGRGKAPPARPGVG